MTLEIKTSEDIFEAITQEKYVYNTHGQTEKEYHCELQKKWVEVDSELEFLKDLKAEVISAFCYKSGRHIKVSDDSKPLLKLIDKRMLELMNKWLKQQDK